MLRKFFIAATNHATNFYPAPNVNLGMDLEDLEGTAKS